MSEWKGMNEGGLTVLWNQIKANFVSSVGFSNDKLTWAKGGVAQTPITIGYASVAGKLGTATVGASNRPIYLNAGTATQVTSVGEGFLSWGGADHVGGAQTPVNALLIPEMKNNAAAFIPASKVTIEYSRDGGTTWLDYGSSDAQKTGLFTEGIGATLKLGKESATTGVDYTGYMVRVTIDTEGFMYRNLVKFAVKASSTTSASYGNYYLTLETRTQQDKEDEADVWTKVIDKGALRAHFNVYDVTPFTTWYSTLSSKTTPGQIRFTFGCDSYTSSSPTIYSIYVFARTFYGTSYVPNNMVGTGHLYSYDTSQNATFPANVSATTFYENGTALASKYLGISAQAVDADKVDGTHLNTFYKHGRAYANDSGTTDKPWYMVAEYTHSTDSISQTVLSMYVFGRYDKASGGILNIRLRFSKDATSPAKLDATWLVASDIDTSDFVVTWKISDGTLYIRLYTRVVSWKYYSFRKLDEHTWGLPTDEWTLDSQTYTADGALAAIPQDETQVESELKGTDNTAARAAADGSGNTIISSYAASLSLSGLVLTLKSKSDTTLSTVTLPTADASTAGVVSTSAQTFAGSKTFNDQVIIANNTSLACKKSGGAVRNILRINSDDEFYIGPSETNDSTRLKMYGQDLRFFVRPDSTSNVLMATIDGGGFMSESGVAAKGITDLGMSGAGVGTVTSVSVNSGIPVPPDASGNVNLSISIPTESTVAGWGFTKNTGTITGITMNGASKGTSGVVDLGTVITSHQSIYGLTIKNSAGTSVLSYNPKTAAGELTLTKAMVGLGNVSNQTITVTSSSVSDGTNTFDKYVHPTTAGYKHIPSGGSTGQFLVYGGSSGTASWSDQSNITAGALTTVSKTAWGRTYWTANGVPDSISGNMDDVGIITVNNGQPITFKTADGTGILRAFVVNSDNNVCVGPFRADETAKTIIYGSEMEFRTKVTGGSELAMRIDSSKNICITNNKGIQWLNASGGSYVSILKVDSSYNAQVGDGGLSLGLYGADMSFYIGSDLALSIDSNKDITTQGNIIFQNSASVRGYNAAGTGTIQVLAMTTSSSNDIVRIGSSSYTTRLYGSTIVFYSGSSTRVSINSNGYLVCTRYAQFYNNYGIRMYKSGNSTVLGVMKIDSSDYLNIGEGTIGSKFYGTDMTFYIGSDIALSIDANKNLTSQGNIVAMGGVAAGGIADLSIN